MEKEIWGPSSLFLIWQFSSVRSSESCAPVTNNVYRPSSACGGYAYVHGAITVNSYYSYYLLLMNIAYECMSLYSLCKFICQVSPLALDRKDTQSDREHGGQSQPSLTEMHATERSTAMRLSWAAAVLFSVYYLIYLWYRFKSWLPGWPSVSSGLG